MAHGFGKLAKIYGITTWRVSPYQQAVFKNTFSEGVANTIRRIRSQIFIVGPPFVIAYAIKEWADAEFKRQQRKNPADFVNDV